MPNKQKNKLATHPSRRGPSLWLLHQKRAAQQALRELIRSRWSSITTIAVIAIAISLPSGLLLFLKNFQILSKPWAQNPKIALYLHQTTSKQKINDLQLKLNQMTDVSEIKYISPKQGFNELKKAMHINRITAAIPSNPIPPLIEVSPTKQSSSPKYLKKLLTRLKKIPEVDMAQLDMQWIKRLHYLLILGQRLTSTLFALFSIAVALIVSHTIRLTAGQLRQKEITILTRLGATQAFIQRPTRYQGLFYGVFGGITACLLVNAALAWIASPAMPLAATYHNHFSIHFMTLKTILIILVLSGLAGWLGSWISDKKKQK